MPSSRTIENTMDWLAKRVGFVDMVCCNSYSQEQIYSENSASDYQLNPVNLPSSWDLDDSSVEEQEHIAGIYDETDSNAKKFQQEPLTPQFKDIESPARSISTATTVTTSTTTTVITSAKANPNGDHNISAERPGNHSNYDLTSRILKDSLSSSNASRSKPHEICFDRMSIRDPKSGQSSRYPFSSVTEGYQL
mmetsp:Transcript_10983/g.16161  ORF Transcript_10983/g.16161 Transcript_10983/m.16161 type:complete len:193 (-) Transcript_10983:78-656(-)